MIRRSDMNGLWRSTSWRKGKTMWLIIVLVDMRNVSRRRKRKKRRKGKKNRRRRNEVRKRFPIKNDKLPIFYSWIMLYWKKGKLIKNIIPIIFMFILFFPFIYLIYDLSSLLGNQQRSKAFENIFFWDFFLRRNSLPQPI